MQNVQKNKWIIQHKLIVLHGECYVIYMIYQCFYFLFYFFTYDETVVIKIQFVIKYNTKKFHWGTCIDI